MVSKRASGFTIVELLIVIIVIAILAGIVLVSYSGVTKKATEAAMRSDLQSAQALVEITAGPSGKIVSDIRTATGGKGLSTSAGNQLLYLKMGKGYCIAVMNPKTSAVYHIGTSDAQPTDGGCASSVMVTQAAQQMENGIFGVGFNADGLMYVKAPSGKIYSIDQSGTATFIAGSSTTGYLNGTGAAAQFNSGDGRIAVDGAGNVIFADERNNVIRKITPGGVVTTVAGVAGSTTSVDGAYGVATMNRPNGVWADPSGIIYVAETYGGKIRKIASDGSMTTLASGVYQPSAVAIDGQGAAYVTSGWTSDVKKISSTGVSSLFAGNSSTAGYVDGMGVSTRFSNPSGTAIDASGNIFVADYGNKLIRVINANGAVFTLAGTGVSGLATGTGATAQFYSPSAMAFDATGALFVAQPWASTGMRKLSF